MLRSGIYGLCIGDALGVPAECRTRESLKENPITDMECGGVRRQPVGYWSDDSSMTLCTVASFGEAGYFHTHDLMNRFLKWWQDGEYTPGGECFDFGHTTAKALHRAEKGVTPALCGSNKPNENGNGSLMRILPAAYILHQKYGGDITLSGKAMEDIHKLSALTHRHPLAQSACGIYTAVAVRLLDGQDLEEAITEGIRSSLIWYGRHRRFGCALSHWDRIANMESFKMLLEPEIRSHGYVVDTLEAALWCLLHTDSYADCVLKAVNLGSDTDTTAAVAGGLAGIYYGMDGIPEQWIRQLAGKEIIEDCCRKMEVRYGAGTILSK